MVYIQQKALTLLKSVTIKTILIFLVKSLKVFNFILQEENKQISVSETFFNKVSTNI